MWNYTKDQLAMFLYKFVISLHIAREIFTISFAGEIHKKRIGRT